MRYKLLALGVFFLLGVVAVDAMSQEIKTNELEDVKVGRQYVISIDATLGDETADILIDIDGDVDYNLFEDRTKICLTPTSKGVIKIRIVSIWWNAKKVDQKIIKILVGAGEGPNPPPVDEPGEPDTPVSDYTKLTAEVKDLVKDINDPTGKKALADIYSKLSAAVAAKTKIEIEYFGRTMVYDLSVDEFVNTHVTSAISRALALAKSKDPTTDQTDWESLFLVPLRDKADAFSLDDRVTFSKFLAAVAAGL